MPDHVLLFTALSPGRVTDTELDRLRVLNAYELTIVEQSYMDTIKPSLNIAPHANASFPNLGATGVIRDERFKNNLSILYQGRSFLDSTVELHRLNQTGNKRSQRTRDKMSANNAGVQISVEDKLTGKVTVYSTKSEASKVLGISMRTLSRWCRAPTVVRSTKVGIQITVKIYS